MTFSELKIGDKFYAKPTKTKNGVDLIEYQKTKYNQTFPDKNDDIYIWNSMSIKTYEFRFFKDNAEVWLDNTPK